jgi:hypothetical protein
VAIVGGGIGGAFAAHALRRELAARPLPSGDDDVAIDV